MKFTPILFFAQPFFTADTSAWYSAELAESFPANLRADPDICICLGPVLVKHAAGEPSAGLG